MGNCFITKCLYVQGSAITVIASSTCTRKLLGTNHTTSFAAVELYRLLRYRDSTQGIGPVRVWICASASVGTIVS